MQKILFLFAPGAGAGSSHPWMKRWGALLSGIGTVRTLDYPYMLEGRKRPDRLPKLIEAHLAALKSVRRRSADTVVLIGKSMGSRVGCHVSLKAKVDYVVCLSYPLCGAGDRTKLRDQVLLAVKTPALFVQGTRDPLCPLDLLAKVRRRMKAPNRLQKVVGGDHSLLVTKRELKATDTTQIAVEQAVVSMIGQFVRGDVQRGRERLAAHA
jgi:predicted alpha/beta-hydrolase family hydrolase